MDIKKNNLKESIETDNLNKIFIYYLKKNANGDEIPLKDFLVETEKTLIGKALDLSQGRQKDACNLLNIKMSTLNQKIKRYKININKEKYTPDSKSMVKKVQ